VARRGSRGRAAVDWDAVADVTLPELRGADRGDLRPAGLHDGLDFDGVEFGDVAAEGASLLECRLTGCAVGEARMPRGRLASCVLADLRATALDTSGSKWSDVVVRGSRIGALIAYGANLTRVTFDHDRFDYLNLHGATAAQVQFVGCRIGELDLGSGRLTDVRLHSCEVGRLVLTGSVLDEVDLRGADLAALEGIGSLAGSVISEDQLARLAPALAAHHGIRVSPPD